MNRGVQLDGDLVDLEEWAEALPPGGDPWVDVLPHDIGPRFVLRSEQFATAQGGEELLQHARALVARLNGAMALTANAQPVGTSTIVTYCPDGTVTREIHLHLEDRGVRARDSLSLQINGEDASMPNPTSPARRWCAAAEVEDPTDAELHRRPALVGDLLVQLGRCDNWFDIYKAIELAERLAGDQSTLLSLAGAEASALKNARTTANFYRHARAHRPSRPATLAEAREIAFLAARLVLPS